MDVSGKVMQKRSGPWLRVLVDGLLYSDCRLTRIIRAERDEADKANGKK